MYGEGLTVSLAMFFLAAMPILIPHVRKYSGRLFLFGTGSLIGICIFDLGPEVIENGGVSSISLVIIVWFAYSLFHLFHSHHHTHEIKTQEATHSTTACKGTYSPYLFLVAISTHCFTSGLLLGVSRQFSPRLSHAIFTALLAHKIYEALAVSSLLLSYRKKISWTLKMIGVYLVSFPLGIFFTEIFKTQIHHSTVLIISGLALGSLAGCLVFDFLVPSLKYLKHRATEVAWLIAGIVLTFFFV